MLEDLMKRAVEEFKAAERARDEVLVRARRARMLSKQAILLLHNGDVPGAELRLGEARQLLSELSRLLDKHRDFLGLEDVRAAEEEYAEAAIFHGLKISNDFPSLEELGVSLQAYLLGLGDVVGELRRGAIDSLRLGDVEGAEANLRLMEGIYIGLLSMEEASLLLKGLRRKLDIARSVIESTRGELTTEVGRRRLSESMRQLAERLDK